jgi:UDP-N-acetylglucosamine 2-epimerase (non-hydrolysing)
MAPPIKELRSRGEAFDVKVCLTAQHRELLDQVIKTFSIDVDYDLNLMRAGQTLFDVTADVLLGMGKVIDQTHPDVVMVQGDTTTSFAAALAAYYRQTRVAHVEAGLRTGDKFRPFPEEINRRLCDALCDYHYAPTPRAKNNLLRENIPAEGILVTGNTVIDALLDVANRPEPFTGAPLDRVGRDRRLVLVTAHRRESFGEAFVQMCMAMRDLVRRNADVEIVYPVHPNPNVRRPVDQILGGEERIYLVSPLDYVPFVHLLKRSAVVLTDSGGIQEEAPSLGKPVLVMRDVTERPEAIEAGTAMLVGTSYRSILDNTERLLNDSALYTRMANAVNPYGDGQASKRIVDHLAVAGEKLG